MAKIINLLLIVSWRRLGNQSRNFGSRFYVKGSTGQFWIWKECMRTAELKSETMKMD